jgi:hypothetical protein
MPRGTVLSPIRLGVTLPNRLQAGQMGPRNTAASTPNAAGQGGRAAPPAVSILQPGPANIRVQTDNRLTQQIQESSRIIASAAKAHPEALCHIVENVSLVNGSVNVSHGLGIPFRGARVESPSANHSWWIQRPSGIPADAEQVTVFASGAMTVDVIVWG